MKPLVSILINNYNNGEYLDFCVQSALNQTYKNTEIIVYDDGSTDDSVEVLKKYKKDVKLILAESNYGASSINFNQANAVYQAFLESKGEIICLLDGDDGFFPEKVERVVEAFGNGDSKVLVQHYFQLIDVENCVLSERHPVRLIHPNETGEFAYRDFILKYNTVFELFMQTSALSFSRDFLENELPVVEDGFDKIWTDFRLTRSAAFHGRIVTLRQPLSYYRMHQLNWIKNIKGEFKKDLVVQVYEYVNQNLISKKGNKIVYVKYLRKKWFSIFYLRHRCFKFLMLLFRRLDSLYQSKIINS